MMKSEIHFPQREIKIISADIEFKCVISPPEFERMLQIFNEQEMEPVMRLTVVDENGDTAEFTNLRLVQDV